LQENIMFNRTHALATHSAKATSRLRDVFGTIASIFALALVAAAAPLLIRTAPDGLNLTRWLFLVALAQPGMFATWALMHKRMSAYAEGHKTPAAVVASILMVAASAAILVFVAPFIIEMWLWA
jgi:hypothetical protein